MNTFEEFLKNHYITSIEQLDENIKKVNEDENVTDNIEPDLSATTDNKSELSKKDDKTNDNYFFKNILFFTNERNDEKNKTLKNLVNAIKGKDVNIITFVAEEVHYKSDEGKIHIEDDKTKFDITDESNVDTICIVRLGAQDSEECCECIKEIQDWGIFTLNPIQYAKRASNKYSSSVLMERYGIPQPNFTLVCRNDIEKGMQSLSKKLKDVHKEAKNYESEEAENLEYVVKILDGHGGTGVFMVTGKTILAILQAMFAIDPERELLVQSKEEADGGDIRVHVLTMRTEQKILAAMKRKKLGKDFRSNVSLGAQAEKVEITKEQEEIALKVAKISGMPWCAVDIMPLIEGSNERFKEFGYNVVLEYNSSPGTDGISEVIGENFMKLLLDNINDLNQLVLAPKSIGYIENITFTMEDESEIEFEAKLDTGNGAKASTIGCENVEIKGEDVTATINGKKYKFKKHGESKAIVGQVTEVRTTVLVPCIRIGSRKLLDVEFALVDNRNKQQKVLLNRDIMSKLAYTINPQKKHLLIDEFADLKVVDNKK